MRLSAGVGVGSREDAKPTLVEIDNSLIEGVNLRTSYLGNRIMRFRIFLVSLTLLNMNDQPKTGRLEVPMFRGFIWLVASIAGLWFVLRAAEPRQIGENLYPYYFGYAAAIFLAFEWGRVFGGLYNEWWANYIQVFISVAVPTFALWLLWGAEATPPFSDLT